MGGFECSCSRANFQGNRQYHAHRRGAFFVEAKVAVGKNKATKASKATPAIDNCKGRVQRKVLVERGARFRCFNRCLHRKGARLVPGTPYLTAWANSGKSGRARREQGGERDQPRYLCARKWVAPFALFRSGASACSRVLATNRASATLGAGRWYRLYGLSDHGEELL